MSTAQNVSNYPEDMVRASRMGGLEENWVEDTVGAVVGSLEDFARAQPLQFAAWAFGIGFFLGWKLKIW